MHSEDQHLTVQNKSEILTVEWVIRVANAKAYNPLEFVAWAWQPFLVLTHLSSIKHDRFSCALFWHRQMIWAAAYECKTQVWMKQ